MGEQRWSEVGGGLIDLGRMFMAGPVRVPAMRAYRSVCTCVRVNVRACVFRFVSACLRVCRVRARQLMLAHCSTAA